VPRALVVKAKRAACCAPSGKPTTQDLTAFASLFKALGDETRLSILGFLRAKQDTLCACEIEGHVKDLSQPTISHHLRLLREAGLVTAERRGTWVYYAIDESVRKRLLEFAGYLGD
jgi:ArsR family transcriptional regulator, arsenate/arsenite/antimonite-responsive transcriptional repressor